MQETLIAQQGELSHAVMRLMSSWRADPEQFDRDAFGHSEELLGRPALWQGQRAVIQGAVVALQERKPLVVASGHGLGKDYVASILALWFLYAHLEGSCKVIITGPTDRQVKEIMWNEIEMRWAERKIELPGRVLKGKIDVRPDIFVLGFTTSETNQMVGKFQGFHAKSLCVIATEAQAIHDKIFEQFDGILTGEQVLLVLLGNPLTTSGRFSKMIDNQADNIVVQLDCERNPNFLEKRTVIPGLTSHVWIEQKRKEWNADGSGEHPLWRSRVKGLKPLRAINCVFDAEIISIARDRALVNPRQSYCVACDPAWYGDDDDVVLGGCLGQVKSPVDKEPKSTPNSTCARIQAMRAKITGDNSIFNRGTLVAVDTSGGYGVGICAMLRSMRMTVLELNSAESPPLDFPQREQYKNMRIALWSFAAEQCRKGKVAIPDDEELIADLTEPRYFYTAGKMQLESKSDIKERLGRSPGKGDAFVMWVWGLSRAQEIAPRIDDYGTARRGGAFGVASGVMVPGL